MMLDYQYISISITIITISTIIFGNYNNYYLICFVRLFGRLVGWFLAVFGACRLCVVQ